MKDTQPQLMGQARVIERGLAWFGGGAQGSAFESNIDDLDGFQIKLNAQGIHSIHRAYKFEMLQGNKVPTKLLTINTIATRSQWPTEQLKLKVGDVVDLYSWRQGEYLQFGFRKGDVK